VVANAEVDLRVRNAALGFTGATQYLPLYTAEAASSWYSSWVPLRRRTTAMRSPVSSAILLALVALQPAASIAAEPNNLRVCADPNNLPFSNSAGEGFENKLAEMVAQHFGKAVVYTWWA
jgi:hypothetical protein